MSDAKLPRLAALGLVLGAMLGMAGTFVPSASLRGLLWGVDGTLLTVSAALLTIHHVRRGNDLVASGFLVYAIGQGLVVSTSRMDLVAAVPLFGAGAALWSASLALVSASLTMPALVRIAGFVGSVLFAIVALQIFSGEVLTALSEPLPFLAYPFLAAALLGWAWVHASGAPGKHGAS